MKTPLVTVAIPFHNAAGTLHYAVESVLRQSFSDFELLLVNDGSTDDSLAVASRYAYDARVRLLNQGGNLGLAARLNQVAFEALGQYVARMDADDLMHPQRLERQVQHLEANPDIDVLGTGIWLIDRDYRIIGYKATPQVRLCRRFQFLHFFHPTIMGRREWFQSNPYSTMFSRCEDGELWFRTAGSSRFAHLPDPLFFHLPSFVVDVRKSATSLRQYRDVLRLHRTRLCPACRCRLTASTYLRSATFQVLAAAKLTQWAVRTLSSEPFEQTEIESAARVLGDTRRAADDRLHSRRWFAASPAAAPDSRRLHSRAPVVFGTTEWYGTRAPFHPPERWPELESLGTFERGDNGMYGAVRDLFAHMRLDEEHAGSPAWNPLARWIRPGMRVAIKPNWVKHEHGSNLGTHTLCTDTSLLRVLIDYTLVALRGRGEVVVADSPLQGSDFPRYRDRGGLDALESHYLGIAAPVRFLDLRFEWAEIDDETNFIKKRHRLKGDPEGYAIIDLGEESCLAPFSGARFGVTDYRTANTNSHHSDGHHRYCVSRTILSSDVLINVPKLKTHLKTGITGALKNMIGINCSKEYLAHYRLGSPSCGGDEYPDGSQLSRYGTLSRALLQEHGPIWLWSAFRRIYERIGGADALGIVHGGGWHGNDTLWRTVHDIVRIARDFNSEGTRRVDPRPILTFVDAIVAGEGPGPLLARPKPCGLLIFGEDPGPIDMVCATMMGFDWRRIPLLAEGARQFGWEDAWFDASSPGLREFVLSGGGSFQPPPGWAGAIEIVTEAREVA